MSNSTLIQLREVDNINTNGDSINGSFTVPCDDRILINTNDTVVLNSAFIDTRSETSGRIIIDDSNKDFSIQNGLYLNNHLKEPHTNSDFSVSKLTGVTRSQPDGFNYVLCNKSTTAGKALVKITSITIKLSDDVKNKHDRNVYFTYVDTTLIRRNLVLVAKANNHKSSTYQLLLPSGSGELNILAVVQDKSDPLPAGYNIFSTSTDPNGDFAIQLSTANDSGYPDDYFQPFSHMRNKLSYEVTYVAAANGVYLSPTIYSLNFSLPTGSYTPDALAKAITDQCSNYTATSTTVGVFQPSFNNDIVSDFPTKSPFLTSIQQLQTDPDFGFKVSGSADVPDIYFASEDGKSILEIKKDAANNYGIGSPLVSLIYDQELNKFVWESINAAIIGTNGTPACIYMGNGTSDEYYVANKHSGIFFTTLENTRMWSDDLGFDSSILTTFGGTVVGTYDALSNFTLPTTTFIDGVNVTGSFAGIDLAYQKKSTYTADGYMYAPVLTPDATTGAAAVIITTTNTGIIASNSVQTDLIDEGYFIIEIDGFNSNNVLNAANTRIKGIVSKYYSQGNFTTMQDRTGALSFTNSGIPFYLSSLSVRILNPDASIPDHLGDNNTLFLEIIKAVEQ